MAELYEPSHDAEEKAQHGVQDSEPKATAELKPDAAASKPDAAAAKADTVAPAPTKTPATADKPITRVDRLFAWLSIVLCYPIVLVFPISEHSLGGLLMLAVLFVFGTAYLLCTGIRPKSVGLAFGAGSLVLALTLITGEANEFHDLFYIALIFAFFRFMYDAVGLGGRGLLGANFFAHLPNFLFRYPCSGLTAIFFTLFSRRKKEGHPDARNHTVAYAVAGLVLAVLPTAVIVNLLSYDSGFTDLLNRIFVLPLQGVSTFGKNLFFACLLAILFFGVLYSAKAKSQLNGGREAEVKTGFTHFAPATVLCAAVTPVLCVYMIFFISQFGYYVSAFTGVLPASISYAEYARDGFFQLNAVCTVNAVLLLLLNVLEKREPSKPKKSLGVRIYSTVTILFTLVLAATALSKMMLYIGYYGLTLKRVEASWLILLLTALFVVILPHFWSEKYPVVPASVICTFLFLALLLLPNINAFIAEYNVDHYISGDIDTVDLYAMESLGDSAVPAVARLERAFAGKEISVSDKDLLPEEVSAFLDRYAQEIQGEQKSIFSFNLPAMRAKRAVEAR